MILDKNLVIPSGNFKLSKKIETLDEFWNVLKNNKSLFARHKMYPCAFMYAWQIRTVKIWLDQGWFWTADPAE